MSPPSGAGYKSPKLIKIMEGNEYYGNTPSKVRQTRRLGLYDSVRTGLFFTLSMASLILVCLNTVTIYQEESRIRALTSSMTDVGYIMSEMDDMIRSEIKPRIYLVSSLLSYKLPNAILDAFKKSNHELTDSLKGITIDLENLIDLYRAILGFNDDWVISPDTQHLTCSLLPTDKTKQVFDRLFKARDDYISGLRFQKADGGGVVINSANSSVIEAVTPQQNGTMWQGLYKKISEILGGNSNKSTIQQLLSLLQSEEIAESLNDTENSPTPTPPTADSHKRRRRYAVDMVTVNGDPSKGQRRQKKPRYDLHFITNRVEDVCQFTKKVLGLSYGKCPRESKILDLISCITQG